MKKVYVVLECAVESKTCLYHSSYEQCKLGALNKYVKCRNIGLDVLPRLCFFVAAQIAQVAQPILLKQIEQVGQSGLQ